MRLLFISFLLILSCIALVIPNIIYDFLLELGLSWTISFIMPKLILHISVISAIIISRKRLLLLTTCILGIGLIIIDFYLAPIYLEDYNKKGQEITSDLSNNKLKQEIFSSKPTYNGIICVASISCPFCRTAMSRLKKMKKREPDLDITIVLYTLDTAKLLAYQLETQTQEFDYLLAPGQEDIMEITNGAFPYFIYAKDNQFIHKWSNNDFGYPAKDWVENRLN